MTPTPDDPSREFALEVVERLQQAGYTALWAGGCVRDLLMGRTPQDYDVATDALPAHVRDLFGHGRTLAVGESFGVIIVLGPRINGETLKVEVATFRAEGAYLDGRRPDPQHIRFCTPEEDARRRDFTINGMFYEPTRSEVLDFVGGERDLRDGIVRAIGRPHDRMSEDKLRMLRAVRFAAALDFELDEATAAAIHDMSAELSVVSAERIGQELRKMLLNRHRRRAVRLLQQVGLLSVLFPELTPTLGETEPRNWSHTLDTLDRLPSPEFEVALAVLLRPALGDMPDAATAAVGQAARAICRRLRLSNKEVSQTGWLVAHREHLEEAAELPIAQLKRRLAQPFAHGLIQWMRADSEAAARESPALRFLDEYLRQTPGDEINPRPLLSGDDLISLGAAPGPRFQQLLNEVRDAQLEGRIQTREDALETARKLLAAGTGGMPRGGDRL